MKGSNNMTVFMFPYSADLCMHNVYMYELNNKLLLITK